MISVQTPRFPGEDSFPALKSATFFLYPLMGRTDSKLWSLPLISTLIPSWDNTHMTSSMSHYLPKVPPPNITTLKVGAYGFMIEI